MEFVGRLVYASQVLVRMKPFMGPLRSWKAAIRGGVGGHGPSHGDDGFGPLARDPGKRTLHCARQRMLRAGWMGALGSGSAGSKESPMVLLARGDLPYLFKDGKASVVELLGSLVALRAFGWMRERARTTWPMNA